MLFADTISKTVSYGYSNISTLNLSEAWIVAILYSMQLYFDFSGYCDMAIGVANCFHLDLPENFKNPYFADSISEFWKRWHITLTNFLTKYVYIPLGGNRKGKSRTLLNILIVYLISGIWHGADWSFVFWGVLHGIACCFHRICGNIWGKIPEFLRIIGTFIYVTIAWVFFRADSMGDALSFIRVMFWGKAGGVSGEFLKSFDVLELVYIEDHVGVLNRLVSGCPTINMIIILMISTLALVMEGTFAKKAFKPTFFTGVACFVFLLWSVLSLSGVSVFLYFNF